MVRIDKMYFTLRETAARWELAMEDLGYLAENGDLRVSTRLEGAYLERGTIEIERGQEFRIPHEQEWFSGIIDLRRRDAYHIFREGIAELVYFHAEGDEYAAVIEPTPSVVVRLDHLVVRRDERNRIEAVHESAGHTVAEGIGFQHSLDYRNVRVGTTELALGAVQAEVIAPATPGRALRKSVVRREVAPVRRRRDLAAHVGHLQVAEAVAAADQVRWPRPVPAAPEAGVILCGLVAAFSPIPHRSHNVLPKLLILR